jgi:CBS domain-containing protein
MNRLTNLGAHLSRPTDSIRAVLERINASAHLFQLVVDDEGRLLGTITDGDVRRAMLRGLSLDGPASSCLQPAPKFGVVGQDDENLRILGSVPRREQFLPLVDDTHHVREILVRSPSDGIFTALVMAGGPGTRLGERTRTKPKPLLDVGGRPILDRVLEGIESAGVQRITIAVHYLAEQLEDFVAKRRNTAVIDVVREPIRLGTAGALGLLDPIIVGSSPILVVNGDLVTRVDFRALHDFHVRHGNDGTIGVATYRTDIPFGVVRHNAEGQFERIDEKPQLSHFVAAGVYYVGPQFLALVPKNQPCDMPHLLNQGSGIGLTIGLCPIHEQWADIGRPADFEAIEAEFQRQQPLGK